MADTDDTEDANIVDEQRRDREDNALAVLDRQPQMTTIDRGAHALAQSARAFIEARVMMARQFPRHLPAVRVRIAKALQRPSVAEGAMYALPRGEKPACSRCGGDWKGDRHSCPPGQYQIEADAREKVWVPNLVEGESIRMAMIMLKAMSHMDAGDKLISDDDDVRTVRVEAIDFESMSTRHKEVVIRKVVERKEITLRFGRDKGKKVPPDREILGSRTNSQGQTVYLCRATEDEVNERANALISKALRKCILDLIDDDIREDARRQAKATARSTAAANRAATINSLRNSYSRIGVDQVAIADYLGRPLDDASADQLELLTGLLTAINDREDGMTWDKAVKSKAEAEAGRAAAAADEQGAADLAKAAAEDGTRKKPRERPADKVDRTLGKDSEGKA